MNEPSGAPVVSVASVFQWLNFRLCLRSICRLVFKEAVNCKLAVCIIMWPTIVYHMQRSMAFQAVHMGLLACRLHFAVFSLALCATDHRLSTTDHQEGQHLQNFNLNASSKFHTLLTWPFKCCRHCRHGS